MTIEPDGTIVLDMTLPDASGFDVLERLDADGTAGFPPVIVYTARALDDVDVAERCP